MNKKYIITLLCTDTDGQYYNDIIEEEFDTFESAMNCVNKCIEEERISLENGDTKVVIKKHDRGKQLWAYGLCLTDYEIREVRRNGN